MHDENLLRDSHDLWWVRSCLVEWSIAGRNAVVTGANSGIGFAVAIALVRAGAPTTLAVRDMDAGRAAADRIHAATGEDVATEHLDLTDRDSIGAFVERYTAEHDDLGVLVNNAGGIFGSRRVTAEGFEMTLATNHLGPFLLTHGLTPLLCASAPARVINVASSGHGFAADGIRFDDIEFSSKYSMRGAYGQSKLANILHAREFDARYGKLGVHAFSMHPGLVTTDIGRGGDSRIASVVWRITRWRQRTPTEGADTAVWLATSPNLPHPPGGYFEDREEGRSTRWARDDEQARRLWEYSEELLGVTGEASTP